MSRSWVPCSEINLDRLVEVWNGCLPEAYRVDSELVGRLGRDHACYRDDLSWAVMDGNKVLGFAEVKDPPFSLYDVKDRETLHLHSLAFSSEEAGREVLGRVLDSVGGRRMVFGGDHGHFWPGVPEGWTTGAAVLSGAGFSPHGGDSVDLECDLRTVDFEATAVAPLEAAGVEFRRGSEGDEAELDRFLREEFPGRWRYDVLSRFAVEPGDIFILLVEGRIEGFAFTQSWESRGPAVAGCVWRLDLGEHWGGLGPIGVSAGVRGRGFGGAVLVGALTGLQAAGVRRCIIDWTDLAAFYEKYGFSVARRYGGWSRS